MKNTLELDKELLERLTTKTNRSKNQTNFLYDLLGGDFNKLLVLEEKLKNTLSFACPSDMEEVEKVLSKESKYNLLDLSEFKK